MTVKQRTLGLWTLTALVVANMVGAGVFTTSGFALGDLGSPVVVLWAWVIGGLIALCGAMSYGALARLHPESGGEYLYLSRVIHPCAGFIAGWVSLLAGFTAAIAYAALTFVAYAFPSLSSTVTVNLVATGLVLVTMGLHAFQLDQGARLQNFAVAVKIVLMLGFCAYAVFGVGFTAWPGVVDSGRATEPVGSFSPGAFALTLMWISFSYSGFNAAVYLADEVPAARRQIPRALVLGVAVVTLLYLVMNTVFVFAPAIEVAAHQEDIAAVAATAVGGESLDLAIRMIVALALFTSVSAMVMTGPRVYAKMADEGLFPARLRFAGEVPKVAVIAQGILAIVVVWIAGLQQLLSYLGFTLGLSAVATVASLFVAARRATDCSLKLPGYPWAPALFVVATLSFAVLAAVINPWEMLAALLTMASGGLLYLWMLRKGRMNGL